MKTTKFLLIVFYTLGCFYSFAQENTYPIVETGVSQFYNNTSIISEPNEGEAFYGQDASYQSQAPSYTNHMDGTISDNITGLMWQQDMGEKISYSSAFIKADTMTLGGYTDWRVPTVKELYSLIMFYGKVSGETPITLFIDSTYFNQPYGDESIGERLIDAQTWSSTQYISTTMNNDSTVFGVNFIDGRIKGYPQYAPGSNNTVENSMYFRMVRGNPNYGINNFVNNNDGTVSDLATGLMWQQADDGNTRDWENAISYAENLSLATYTDWRLPDAKELHSIVDYSRCPDITNSAAIDPIFSTTSISDPDGNSGQYPYFWTSSSHLDGINPYSSAVYIAFGEAQGQMESPPNSGNYQLMDVHGAGAQRSDPKTGNASDYPEFFGPQGDVRYVFNYTRCVRNIETDASINSKQQIQNVHIYPSPTNDFCNIEFETVKTYCKIKLIDTNGKTIMEKEFNNISDIVLNIESINNGIYYLSVSTNHSHSVQKIIKQ